MTKKQNILIVEDDLNTQILYKALLSDKYELFTCDTVLQAKEYLKKDGIDLVILDLSLKGEDDGLVLVRFIRADKKWNKTTILAVTAHAFVFDKERCLEAGCNAFLTKPIRGNTLIGYIQKSLVE
jgi:DNA-binding response OmpR family regulator